MRIGTLLMVLLASHHVVVMVVVVVADDLRLWRQVLVVLMVLVLLLLLHLLLLRLLVVAVVLLLLRHDLQAGVSLLGLVLRLLLPLSALHVVGGRTRTVVVAGLPHVVLRCSGWHACSGGRGAMAGADARGAGRRGRQRRKGWRSGIRRITIPGILLLLVVVVMRGIVLLLVVLGLLLVVLVVLVGRVGLVQLGRGRGWRRMDAGRQLGLLLRMWLMWRL